MVKLNRALAGVAQWIECEPVNQRVTGSIPSQDTCLGCRPGPHLVSLPLFSLPSPLSKQMNNIFKRVKL